MTGTLTKKFNLRITTVHNKPERKKNELRYYANFKERKFESFYKIKTCLQKTTTCIGLWAEQIFSVNI